MAAIKESPGADSELLNNVPHAFTPISSNTDVAIALGINSEDPSGQDEPKGLKEVTRALCIDWTKLFPPGFHQERDDHPVVLDDLCRNYCESEHWRHVLVTSGNANRCVAAG